MLSSITHVIEILALSVALMHFRLICFKDKYESNMQLWDNEIVFRNSQQS